MRIETRIEWLDDARIVAGMLMILDHGLLYIEFSDSWIRYSVTRCVEPIYVYAFGYLIARRTKPPSWKRWVQISLAAILETVLHTLREGQLYFGILANLAVVMPIAPWILGFRPVNLRRLVIGAAILSVVPLRLGGSVFDYGPALLIGQISFASWVARENCPWFGLFAQSWLVTVGTALGVICVTKELAPTFWTSVIGHPIAALFICGLQRYQLSRSLRHSLRWLSEKPLTFYIGHLLMLHLVARFTGA